MSVNTMNFEQAATVLNAIHSQVTGSAQIAPVNTKDFISVAQKTLATGYDPVLNAISQVIGKTIFSIRPYESKFGGLEMDSLMWGAVTRKLTAADKPLTDNDAYSLTEGQSIDMYKVNKPNILETKYMGFLTFSKDVTIFKNQLNAAFQGPEQFGSFMTMVAQNALDMIEQTKENCARLCMANFITGKADANNGVIHLLTEYNTEMGFITPLTAQTVKEPANFKPFIEWAYSRISTLTKLMTERSGLFQIPITGYDINRHTPLRDQKVYLYTDLLNDIDARVLANAYNYEFLKFSDVQSVSYWQNIDTRDEVQATPAYIDSATGAITTAANAVTVSPIMGVIFDRDAMGYTVADEEVAMTPYNTKGKYWNQTYSYVLRYYNDFTEKGIILLLD